MNVMKNNLLAAIRTSGLAFLCASFFLGANTAFPITVTCTNCSTSIVQMLEKLESAEQLTNLVKQVGEATKQTQHQFDILQQEIQQYQNMMQNTMRLPDAAIGQIKGKMTELAALTSELRTQRGDLTSMGQIYTELFPEQMDLRNLAGSDNVEAAKAQYQAHWDEWSAKVDQATQATFQLSGSQLDSMQQDAALFDEYVGNLLSTPEGQMQALMSGNQLAALQIQETRQLRELMATSIQSDLQSQIKSEKESQMTQEQWREMTKTDKLKSLQSKSGQF